MVDLVVVERDGVFVVSGRIVKVAKRKGSNDAAIRPDAFGLGRRMKRRRTRRIVLSALTAALTRRRPRMGCRSSRR
jgi:hypothetical protein